MGSMSRGSALCSSRRRPADCRSSPVTVGAAVRTEFVVRWRYLLLALWGTALAVPTYRNGHVAQSMDWGVLRSAGRYLFSSAGLHLYAHRPDVQVGPPAVALDGLAQWT